MLNEGQKGTRLQEMIKMYEASKFEEQESERDDSESESNFESSEQTEEQYQQKDKINPIYELRCKFLEHLNKMKSNEEEPPHIGASRTIYLILLHITIILGIMFNVFYRNGQEEGFFIGQIVIVSIGAVGLLVIGCYLISYECSMGNYDNEQLFEDLMNLGKMLEEIRQKDANRGEMAIQTDRILLEKENRNQQIDIKSIQQTEEPPFISASKTIFHILFNLGISFNIFFPFLYTHSGDQVWKTITIASGALTSIIACVIGVYLIGYDCSVVDNEQ